MYCVKLFFIYSIVPYHSYLKRAFYIHFYSINYGYTPWTTLVVVSEETLFQKTFEDYSINPELHQQRKYEEKYMQLLTKEKRCLASVVFTAVLLKFSNSQFQ